MTAFPDPPQLGPCPPGATVPGLPEKWTAVTLLTPFTSNQVMVGAVEYDWSLQAMRTTVYGVSSGYADFLTVADKTYLLISEPGQSPTACVGPIPGATWTVPSPDWLASRDVTCNGTGDVLNVNSEWWVGLTKCTNGCEAPVPKGGPPDVGAWFWFHADTREPWRVMFIDKSNPYGLPVLGECTIIHFPTFQAVQSTSLRGLVDMCKSCEDVDADAHALTTDLDKALAAGAARLSPESLKTAAGMVGTLIPGLAPLPGTCSPHTLPSWPDTMYVTAMTTPTAGKANFSTQIFYDWPIKRMLTRLHEPDDTHDDLILTENQTYDLSYKNGKFVKCEKADPVGLPKNDWPTADNCQCRASITNNPQLSPGRTTLIFSCPSSPGRHFWIWYTDDSRPVMFSEVPQKCDVGLVLIDYFDWIAGVELDPEMFKIPDGCA